MTPTETVMLCRYLVACCPQQHMDEYTPDAWHDLLGDLPLDVAKLAVQRVAQRQPFVAASEIRAEAAAIWREQQPARPQLALVADDRTPEQIETTRKRGLSTAREAIGDLEPELRRRARRRT